MLIRIAKDAWPAFCIIILLMGVFGSFFSVCALELDAGWNEYKSDHYVIHYQPGISDDYIREFTRKCEHYYHLLTERMGFTRFSFWLWDNRAKIFIYKTRQDYLKNANLPQWSGASVHISKKFISTFYFEKDFFDKILPHELTHIILREFIGLDAAAPLWFDEGLACANEKDAYTQYLLPAKRLVEDQSYMPVGGMEKLNERGVVLPDIFYPSAASLVIFLLEEYNKERFLQFCRSLRDGNAFYAAMAKIYGIKDARELNDRFLTFLKNKSYEDIAGADGVWR